MIGRVYLERGRPVVVLARWHGQGPRNVLIRREDGTAVVRPFRGLRRALVTPSTATAPLVHSHPLTVSRTCRELVYVECGATSGNGTGNRADIVTDDEGVDETEVEVWARSVGSGSSTSAAVRRTAEPLTPMGGRRTSPQRSRGMGYRSPPPRQ